MSVPSRPTGWPYPCKVKQAQRLHNKKVPERTLQHMRYTACNRYWVLWARNHRKECEERDAKLRADRLLEKGAEGEA